MSTTDIYLLEAENWFLESINPRPVWQRDHADLRMWEHLLWWAVYVNAEPEVA